MKKVIINAILIFIISFGLHLILNINTATDTAYIINILIVVMIHTSVIIALLLKKK
jgi:hypothetical protein